MLLVGRIISGIASASFTTANAYIADVTAPEKRAKSFGMIGAAFGPGFVVGPLVGGWLGGIDLRLPFWFAAGLALLNFLYGWFVLPESLPVERRTPRFDTSHANPFGALTLLRSYPQVFGLSRGGIPTNLAHYVYPSIFVLFADYRYHWGPREVSWVLALVGVLSIVVNAGLVGRTVKVLGERRTLLFGLACGVVGFTVYGLGRQWLAVRCRPAGERAVGAGRAGDAGDDHPPGRAPGTGAHPGCADEPDQPWPASSDRCCSPTCSHCSSARTHRRSCRARRGSWPRCCWRAHGPWAGAMRGCKHRSAGCRMPRPRDARRRVCRNARRRGNARSASCAGSGLAADGDQSFSTARIRPDFASTRTSMLLPSARSASAFHTPSS